MADDAGPNRVCGSVAAPCEAKTAKSALGSARALRRHLSLEPQDQATHRRLGDLCQAQSPATAVPFRARRSALNPKDLGRRLDWAAALDRAGRSAPAARLLR